MNLCPHTALVTEREATAGRHDCTDREAAVTDTCTTAFKQTGAHSRVYTAIHTNQVREDMHRESIYRRTNWKNRDAESTLTIITKTKCRKYT